MTDDDDKKSLGDLRSAQAALDVASEALRKAMEGGEPECRERFAYYLGMARGLLGRIIERVYKPGDGRQ